MKPEAKAMIPGFRPLLEDFVHSIRFQDLQPGEPIPPALTQFLALHPELLAEFEAANTVLPPGADATALRGLCAMPRMSTLAIAAVINAAVGALPDGQAYLNIGVWRGFSLFAGMLGHADRICIGVDDFSLFPDATAFGTGFARRASARHAFFELDYEAYFMGHHRQPIGVYCYDGPHEYEHQLRGLELAEPYLADGAVILVDDANWEAPRRATLDFVARRTGRYRVLADLPTACDRHPTWWNGLLVLQKTG